MQTEYRYRATAQELTWDGRPAGVSIGTRLLVIGIGLFGLTFLLAAALFSRTHIKQDHFDRFVPEIIVAVRTNDIAFFRDRATIKPPCEVGTCKDSPPVAGIFLNYSQFLDTPTYISMLDVWFANAVPGSADVYGDGAPYVRSIRCTSGSDLPPYECFAQGAVITSIQNTAAGPQREVRVISWQKLKGKWQVSGDVLVTPDRPELLAAMLETECQFCHGEWQAK